VNDAVKRQLLLWSGLALLAAFVLCTRRIPTGPAEFAYFPFTPSPLPWAPMRGFTIEQFADHAARLFLLGPALVLLAFAVAGFDLQPLKRASLRTAALAVSGLSICLIAFVMFVVLRGRPIVDDELTYNSMAGTYASGHLALPLMPGMLREPFTVATRIGMTGKYLPGEALVQVPGVLVAFPALMHLPLAALALFCVFRATSLLGDPRIAAWTTIFVAASPMFILCAATSQSQLTSLACCAVAGLGYAYIERERPWLGAMLLAIGVVFGVFTRIQAIVPIGAVLVIAALWRLFRQHRLGSMAFLLALLAGGAGLLFWYDWLLTGKPLMLPWNLFRPPEHYGFGAIWPNDSFHHNLRTLLENLLVSAVRLNVWWLGWPLGLALLIHWLMNGRALIGGGRVWVVAAIAFIAFQAGYYSTGISDVGPIYHFELLIPLAIIGANAVAAAFVRSPRLAAAWLLVNFAIATPAFLWTQTSRLNRLTHTIHDEVDARLARLEKPALLLYEWSCGESLRMGWIHSTFPKRWRTDRDDVITYARPLPRHVATYIAQFPGRHCYYYRRNPDTWAPEVYPCEAAKDLMSRPVGLVNCISLPSTAQKMGLYDPWGEIRRRQQEGPNWRNQRRVKEIE